MKCKRYKAKPLTIESCPLPEDRVSDTVAFEVAGVDSAGPLFLRNALKVWIVLFIYSVCRAVNLELVAFLTTDSFLMAFRRFITGRGRLRTVYSDNGTNFKGSDNEFSTLHWEKLVREANINRILWKFDPLTASWWGGFWNGWFELLKNC
ncbi:hypothetical protein AVEN_179359-1 [Araneus ventricosus]|uniref:Integrase catalytic domain-containing protein n=1 Tax=Araneus ventricosus TaxID=182803 RepID=A0A4Y2H0X2_ARAVE|nr:hypothetical protein AVEN_179359-1 [Araneus ventricosus]